jgi:Zn finger protein HypA/HybF involved in hydrogenase expression
MHEFGVVEVIFKRLLDRLETYKVSKVAQLTFRRSSAFSEEILRQTFSVLSPGTPLAEAELVVEVAVLNYTCECGLTSQVNGEDLIGHMFICPSCGAVREIAEAHDLELIEVVAKSEASLDELAL